LVQLQFLKGIQVLISLRHFNPKNIAHFNEIKHVHDMIPEQVISLKFN